MPTSRFTMTAAPAVETPGDLLVLPFRDGTPLFDARQVPKNLADCRPPKKAEMLPVRLSENRGERTAVCLHRMAGEGDDLVREMKKMVYTALVKARELQQKRVVVPLGASFSRLAPAVQEGALLGGYAFDRYKKKKKRPLPVLLVCNTPPAALKKGALVARYVNEARDLLNEPPAVMNPETLSVAFEESGVQSGLVVETWTRQKLESERCGGILAVGGGSAVPPRLVIGRYIPEQPKLHLALVGKGITFDSGGYSIKPTKSMEDMKMDMAGAAAMWSAACAIASLRLPLRLTVYCPLAHNAISGTAYNVSDIVTTRSGQTVEVVNTDAEGRIILADAITLACEEKPDRLVDAATLTGAAVVALGEDIAAAFGTDREFTGALVRAGAETGERFWEMPLHRPYFSQYDSPVADMKNSGERWAGAIGAALFLQRFVRDVDHWIHLDIAGPGCRIGVLDHLGTGAKGFCVKTIVALAEQLAK